MKQLFTIAALLSLLALPSCVPSSTDERTARRTNTPVGSDYQPSPFYTPAPSGYPAGPDTAPTPYPVIIPMPYPQGTPVPWPTPWATPSSTTSCHRGDAFSCEAEAAMLPMINELRAQRRKSAVSLHPGLSYVSREWSRAQMNRGDIGHEGFPSQRAGAYRSEFGSLDISLTAENVAMNGSGSSAQRAAAALFNQWKNSSGHLENMLGNHTYVGIGVVVNGRSVWGTQIFAVPRR